MSSLEKEMYVLCKELFPINRSLTGDGVRETLSIIKSHLPDLKIAEVHWVVQYKIRDPFAYLFNLRNVENTIRDVSESTMRLMIGDRSFKEVLQKERIAIANEAKVPGAYLE